MDKLDAAFVATLNAIGGAYERLPKQQRLRVERWCEKLSEETVNPAYKRARNAYAAALLAAVEARALGDLFSRFPDEGPLPNLPVHVANAARPRSASASRTPAAAGAASAGAASPSPRRGCCYRVGAAAAAFVQRVALIDTPLGAGSPGAAALAAAAEHGISGERVFESLQDQAAVGDSADLRRHAECYGPGGGCAAGSCGSGAAAGAPPCHCELVAPSSAAGRVRAYGTGTLARFPRYPTERDAGLQAPPPAAAAEPAQPPPPQQPLPQDAAPAGVARAASAALDAVQCPRVLAPATAAAWAPPPAGHTVEPMPSESTAPSGVRMPVIDPPGAPLWAQPLAVLRPPSSLGAVALAAPAVVRSADVQTAAGHAQHPAAVQQAAAAVSSSPAPAAAAPTVAARAPSPAAAPAAADAVPTSMSPLHAVAAHLSSAAAVAAAMAAKADASEAATNAAVWLRPAPPFIPRPLAAGCAPPAAAPATSSSGADPAVVAGGSGAHAGAAGAASDGAHREAAPPSDAPALDGILAALRAAVLGKQAVGSGIHAPQPHARHRIPFVSAASGASTPRWVDGATQSAMPHSSAQRRQPPVPMLWPGPTRGPIYRSSSAPRPAVIASTRVQTRARSTSSKRPPPRDAAPKVTRVVKDAACQCGTSQRQPPKPGSRPHGQTGVAVSRPSAGAASAAPVAGRPRSTSASSTTSSCHLAHATDDDSYCCVSDTAAPASLQAVPRTASSLPQATASAASPVQATASRRCEPPAATAPVADADDVLPAPAALHVAEAHVECAKLRMELASLRTRLEQEIADNARHRRMAQQVVAQPPPPLPAAVPRVPPLAQPPAAPLLQEAALHDPARAARCFDACISAYAPAVVDDSNELPLRAPVTAAGSSARHDAGAATARRVRHRNVAPSAPQRTHVTAPTASKRVIVGGGPAELQDEAALYGLSSPPRAAAVLQPRAAHSGAQVGGSLASAGHARERRIELRQAGVAPAVVQYAAAVLESEGIDLTPELRAAAAGGGRASRVTQVLQRPFVAAPAAPVRRAHAASTFSSRPVVAASPQRLAAPALAAASSAARSPAPRGHTWQSAGDALQEALATMGASLLSLSVTQLPSYDDAGTGMRSVGSIADVTPVIDSSACGAVAAAPAAVAAAPPSLQSTFDTHGQLGACSSLRSDSLSTTSAGSAIGSSPGRLLARPPAASGYKPKAPVVLGPVVPASGAGAASAASPLSASLSAVAASPSVVTPAAADLSGAMRAQQPAAPPPPPASTVSRTDASALFNPSWNEAIVPLPPLPMAAGAAGVVAC